MKSILLALAVVSIFAQSSSVALAADEHAKKGPEQTEAELKKSKLPIEVTKDGNKNAESKKKMSAAQSEKAKSAESDKPAKQKPNPTEMAMRHLKLSITLREGKKFADAFDYLNKAYKHFKKAGNRYWVAACYENYGYLYRDLDSLDLAYAFLREARNIYTKLMKADKGSASAVADILGIPDDERISSVKEKKSKKSKYSKTEKKLTKSKNDANKLVHGDDVHKAINQLGENDIELYDMIRNTNARLNDLDADMRYIKESLEKISKKLDQK